MQQKGWPHTYVHNVQQRSSSHVKLVPLVPLLPQHPWAAGQNNDVPVAWQKPQTAGCVQLQLHEPVVEDALTYATVGTR